MKDYYSFARKASTLALVILQYSAVDAATCGGGVVGDGICSQNGLCCSEYGWCDDTSTHCADYCGGGVVGNSKCKWQDECCSATGVCSSSNCGPSTPSPTPIGGGGGGPQPPSNGDTRLIAYVGNWLACPTADQYDAYTHVVLSFAVTYQWQSSGKHTCDQSCTIIGVPPACAGSNGSTFISDLQAAGKKVLLSFGGAGMGGSWDGLNDCWEYCYGKETSVVNQLVTMVNSMRLDGVDLDYEYYHEDGQNGSAFSKGTEAQIFLTDVTVGLRNNLPSGSIVTHAPMDSDVVPGTGYYNVLVNVASSLDFIMPQYYNGIVRPVSDGFYGSGVGSMSAASHVTTLTNDMFGGDPTKVVFGFCITNCIGTANGGQAAAVMSDYASIFPCNGGAFFWEASQDISGSWSDSVSAAIVPNRGCSSSNPSPTPVPATPVPATPAPGPTDTPAPTSSPVAAPTSSPVDTGDNGGPANRCGSNWQDAGDRCHQMCPGGKNNECPPSEECWAGISCTTTTTSSPVIDKPMSTPSPSKTPAKTPAITSPSPQPSRFPTKSPTNVVITSSPSKVPATMSPSSEPSKSPSQPPTKNAITTSSPTTSVLPSCLPSSAPPDRPTESTSAQPTKSPTVAPSSTPTVAPTATPTPSPVDEEYTGPSNRCGTDWVHARQCHKTCLNGGVDFECDNGETCWTNIQCSTSVPDDSRNRPPVIAAPIDLTASDIPTETSPSSSCGQKVTRVRILELFAVLAVVELMEIVHEYWLY